MSLGDINKDLYGKDSEKSFRPHEEFFGSISDLEKKREFEGRIQFRGRAEEERMFGKGFQKKDYTNLKRNSRIAALAVSAIAVVVFLVWLLFSILGPSFDENKTIVSIEGAREVKSGELVTFTINYENKNRVALDDAELIIRYPENFKPEGNLNFESVGKTSSKINIGKIGKHKDEQLTLGGKFYGPKDVNVSLSAELNYTPSNFNSVFKAQGNYGIKLLSSPVNIEMVAPATTASGNSIGYKISYKNVGDREFGAVKVQMEYPSGFTPTGYTPAPSESNNVWYVGTLGANQIGEITVTGNLDGNKDDVKLAKAGIGFSGEGGFVVFNETSAQTKIIGSPIKITQIVNGLSQVNVNPGDKLEFSIGFKNESAVGIKDLIVTESIDSSILDFSKINLDGKGRYDAKTKNIIWKAVDYKELGNLEPGQSGAINFSIPVKEMIPVKTINDKNFSFISKVVIDSPTVPFPEEGNKIVPSNTIEVKLNSKLVLKTLGYYSDNFIENSGPVPPEVGKETSYTIHWQVINVSNDVGDAVIESSLPSWVKWTGKIYPADGKISYNERTGKVIWNAGRVAAGIGVIEPVSEVAFQVSVTPQEKDIGDELVLINKSKITGKDLFTGEALSSETQQKTTWFKEDASLASGNVVNPD